MKTGTLTMSSKELKRLSVIEQLKGKQITQKEAAKSLNVSPRHMRRLFTEFIKHGASGLISKSRGKASNHRLSSEFKSKVIHFLKKDYADFGPTLANECLNDRQSLKLSVETTRQLMIAQELWQAKVKKSVKVHQQRTRRSQFGELVQIDGSPHDWFEGRSDKCCLLVIVDDATSSILGLRFCKAESTQDYFNLVDSYFKDYGLPMSMYTDKHSVFRVNAKGCADTHLTQFGRAMDELGVELIYASSPEAKGRVERANSTLQDRLIKMMRLDGISNMEQANAYVPEFIKKYNNKFAKTPSKLSNAHSPILELEQLTDILSVQTEKKLNKSLEFKHNLKLYQVQDERKNRLQNKHVTLYENYNGETKMVYGSKELDYKIVTINKTTPEIHNEKTLNSKVDEIKKDINKVPTGHSYQPWKDFKDIERQIAFSA